MCLSWKIQVYSYLDPGTPWRVLVYSSYCFSFRYEQVDSGGAVATELREAVEAVESPHAIGGDGAIGFSEFIGRGGIPSEQGFTWALPCSFPDPMSINDTEPNPRPRSQTRAQSSDGLHPIDAIVAMASNLVAMASTLAQYVFK